VAAARRAAEAAAAEAVRAESAAGTLRDRVGERRDIEAQAAEHRREAEVLGWFGRWLASDRFIDFLLQENLEAICVRASDRLLEMSGGRYTLDLAAEGEDAGSFFVVDRHNADQRRSVATLSGGETFQASLALALALSEGLADLGGAGRLSAVFVDEGFAALDGETLDLAIDALESARADGARMVGVITHVAQMAERIPEGLDVERGATGSRVRRREGGALG
jgi:exonuclease SbcC